MITECRSCKSKNLTDVLNLRDQYLSDFTNPGDPKPEKHPLNLVLCKDCSLVQLKETTPSSSLYTERYGYRSGINTTMRDHLKGIVTEVLKRVDMKEGDIWVDQGSNDGTLLSFVPDYVTKIACEPIKKLAEESKKKSDIIINDFWSYENYRKVTFDKARVITTISMFYDLDNPNTFVADTARALRDDGLWVIQQNYLVSMLKNVAYDNIVHEHIEYYSLTSLEPLLNRHGLEVVDVETNELNGGSFRTYVKHMDSVKRMRMIEQKLKIANQWTYFLFSLHVREATKKLRAFVEEQVKNGKTVYVLGASTRGSTLLQSCGLDYTLIKAAVERNPEKHGKVYGGTGIPIVSEEQARKDKPDYMLCLPWHFRDELIIREKEYVKNGGALVFPLPKVEVYRG